MKNTIIFVIFIFTGFICYAGDIREVSTADTLVMIDAADKGQIFGGLGAISSSSSKLIYDYPEPERSQILDYLFKPSYGSAVQMLKVEIGSDANSTDIAEPSHMRRPGIVRENLGCEWWLMEEAKKRNPEIKLYGLAWGAPAWVGKTFWTKHTIDYLLSWLDLAHDKGFVIDYIGGWNEHGWDIEWYIEFSRAVKERFPHIRIVAADDAGTNWSVVGGLMENREFFDAVDIVGIHSPCGWRTPYVKCQSPEEARNLGKPLWNSEHSAMTHNFGSVPLARAVNRLYIQAGMVSHWCWPLASAWYSTLPYADTGLLLAEWPWSGYYIVGKSIWVYAHTAQFTKPGWQYMDNACGFLPNGASYVTYKSPDRGSFSTVVETCDAVDDITVEFSLSKTFKGDKIYVWSTNLMSDDENEHFVRIRELSLIDRKYTVTLKSGHLYTITNTTGQGRGNGKPMAAVDDLMTLPYEEDFERYGPEKSARYFCDLNGGFETHPAGGGREGLSYRQMIEQQPVSWQAAWHPETLPPVTLVGDPRWWGDYEVSIDILFESSGYVEVLGRVGAQHAAAVAGYHLRLEDTGQWTLYCDELDGFEKREKTLASGKVSMQLNQWHRLGLGMKGNVLSVLYDNRVVGKVKDDYHISGQTGLVTGKWHHVQFDNLRIDKTSEWPEYLPVVGMSIRTTSEHTGFYRGYSYLAANAVDGRPESAWYTEWFPKTGLPQSVTIDLGGMYMVKGIVYQPRHDIKIHKPEESYITKCNIYTGRDHKNFTKVASPAWIPGTSSKWVEWKPENIRYIKLEAVEGSNGKASIGELSVVLK